MNILPARVRRRWYTTELATTLFASLPAFLTAAGGIAKGMRERAADTWRLGVCVLVALLLGTTLKALQSHRKDVRDAARVSPDPFEAALYVLHSAILAMRGLRTDETTVAKLRVTILRVVDAEDVAIQVVPFVGGGSGEEGRRVSRRSGIVGRAILRGMPAASIRDGSFDDYCRTLVRDYAVPVEEARQIPIDRVAFLAVPFRDPRTARVVGVVYMDSPDRTFFSHPDRPRDGISDPFVRRVADACAGLMAYAGLRYPEDAR